MRSDVSLGAFLSGGLDSSLIAFYMSKYSKNPLNTYNISFNEIADILSKTAPRVNNPPVIEPRVTLADIKIATNYLNWEPTVKISDWIEIYKNVLGI